MSFEIACPSQTGSLSPYKSGVDANKRRSDAIIGILQQALEEPNFADGLSDFANALKLLQTARQKIPPETFQSLASLGVGCTADYNTSGKNMPPPNILPGTVRSCGASDGLISSQIIHITDVKSLTPGSTNQTMGSARTFKSVDNKTSSKTTPCYDGLAPAPPVEGLVGFNPGIRVKCFLCDEELKIDGGINFEACQCMFVGEFAHLWNNASALKRKFLGTLLLQMVQWCSDIALGRADSVLAQMDVAVKCASVCKYIDLTGCCASPVLNTQSVSTKDAHDANVEMVDLSSDTDDEEFSRSGDVDK